MLWILITCDINSFILSVLLTPAFLKSKRIPGKFSENLNEQSTIDKIYLYSDLNFKCKAKYREFIQQHSTNYIQWYQTRSILRLQCNVTTTSYGRLHRVIRRGYRKKINLPISRFYSTFPRFFVNKIFQGSQVQTLR